MKKQFLILFAFISVLALSQVPQRFNKVIVTGDITSPKFIKTGSNADSVLLGNGSARAISAIKTDTVSLSNRINAKATGSGTASGNNTGDETLTSIKTKLGAATAVSDGYLKYQDWNIFNSKEPAITKNTAFNKNFGTTPGTVLEGRTFGTAANSAVGDFIQNQNSSAQSANMWISGNGYFGGDVHCGNIRATSSNSNFISSDVSIGYGSYQGYKLAVNGTGYFNSTVTASSFYGNGSNLTGVQLPITLTTNGTSGAATFSGNVLNVPNYAASGGVNQTQTTVNGSTGGYMVCSMPFQTGSYKKVIIYVNSLSGSATYTYPSSFSMIPRASSSLSITAQSTTSITIAGASAIGWCIIEGY